LRLNLSGIWIANQRMIALESETSENTLLLKIETKGAKMKFLATCLIAVTLLLTGCATSNVKTTITSKELETKKSALLVMSLSQPKESVQYGAVTIYFQPKGKETIGRSWVETYSQSTGFLPKPESDFPKEFSLLKVIEVPAGDVEISGWAFSMYQARYESTDASPAYTISVKAGDVIYLGNFSIEPHYGDGIFGVSQVRGALPYINDQSQRDLVMFKKRYPQLPTPINKQLPVGIWATEKYQEMLKVLAEIEKKNPANPKADD